MNTALASLADARNIMVDGQLRPNKVTDRRIVDAMRRLPRELFVPAGQRALAYADVEVPIGGGRVLLAPVAVARLIQAAEAPTGSKVLVLGAGYAAAVFAAFGTQVTVLEQDAEVLETSRMVMTSCGLGATFVSGPLALGWEAGAPYDVIFIDGAVRSLPRLAAQLRDSPPGRLCAVLVPSGRSGVAVVAERVGESLVQRPAFDCTATPMPQFDADEAFHF